MILNDPLIEQDIRARLLRLAARIGTFAIAPPASELDSVAHRYAYRLANHDKPGAGGLAANNVLHDLIDVREWDEIGFWGSALGRACSWWVGFPEPGTTRGIAAAVLKCSRQNVHELVQRGVLKADLATGYISAESLRDEMRARNPLGA